MSESQSRYSIVERLTSTKLGFIDQKSNLTKELEEYKQTIVVKEKDIEAFKKDSEEDRNRQLRGKEREVEQYKQILAFKESQKTKQEEVFDAKIVEVDKALKAIEEISKTAPTPQEQA